MYIDPDDGDRVGLRNFALISFDAADPQDFIQRCLSEEREPGN